MFEKSAGLSVSNSAKPPPYDSQFPEYIESLDVLQSRLEQVNLCLANKFEQLTGSNIRPPQDPEVQEPPSGYMGQTHHAVSQVRREVSNLEVILEAFLSI